jgi:hypothetical protein
VADRAPRGDLVRRARAWAVPLLASGALGVIAIRGILAAAGGPAAPLDDSFIHLQFARGLAGGHPFEYVAGEGYASGATSVLWPLLLAPFHLFGLRDVSLLWAAWLLGTVAHAGTALEAHRLTRRLAGEAAAIGAGAMCALFGAFAWFAWSGMETVALAWLLLWTARAAAARCEPERGGEPTSTRELVALGILAPLIRPEGAVASLVAVVALLHGARSRPVRSSAIAFAPLVGPLVGPLLNLAFTGHATSSTAQVKWMIGNPYYHLDTLAAATLANARLLVTSIMDGGDWTVLFLPEHASVPVLLGAIALPIAAHRRRVPWHGLFTAAVALATLLPCTYGTFLWNRLRYVWPFAGSWMVLAACFTREAGDLVRLLWPRATAITPLLAGGLVAGLGLRLPWALRDLAQSASAIARQQVALGRWAHDTLPATARIGVNDTGAIAYLSGRATFDVVGLTTEGEARYWVGGAGSRFEHYERMPAARRPSHFIVYPQWMACPPVLGRPLHEATVLDQTILGGTTMVAYEARWDLLGSGALPAAPPAGLALADEVDVADLESEAGHGYAIGDGWDTDDIVMTQEVPGSAVDPDTTPPTRIIADGGRVRRAADAFRVRLPATARRELWVRLSAEEPLDLVIRAGGREIGALSLDGDPGWVERGVPLPADLQAGDADVTITARAREAGVDGRFGAFHYWVFGGSG